GTPLNVWECEGCGHRESIGSIAELREKAPDCPADIELHRPFIDAITYKCPHCGKTMYRVPEVIDCWFDSGAMPFAQHHYPFENEELFKQQFPADFISEAVDQTRGWFYSLLAISTLLFDREPFENVIVLGLVQDENGQKMSKSKGNAVDPFEALEKLGADAIRWYFYTNSQPWLPNKFHDKVVIEGQRKFMGTLWNTYAFYIMYADIIGFDPTKYTLDVSKLSVMDKWLLSRMNTMIKGVDENLENYRIPEAAKYMQDFVDELSNWYVRRSRERFWSPELTEDTVNAYMTLYTAISNVCKCAAPMVPFITEEIYQNMVLSVDKNAPESIHLCDFPKYNEALIDSALERKMQEVLDIVVLGRSARNASNRKNRQPLSTMYVKATEQLDVFYTDIIKDELNIKEVVFTDDMAGFASYNFKPQLKTLGPKYGKSLGEIKNALADISANRSGEAMAELNSTGVMKLNISIGEIELTKDDLLIEAQQKEDFCTVFDGGITVALDTALTDELIEEGFVREIVSKIQNMRKDSGFEVMDHIIVKLEGNDKLAAIVKKNEASIKSDVLAEDISAGTTANSKLWNINGEDITIGVEKI
ncbi:MAG: class I tRNA ligase family protein, partial [Ruminiclostridium sp.]|nr:class I tRNA ligase family protein [Ruminiclostridium sp.]